MRPNSFLIIALAALCFACQEDSSGADSEGDIIQLRADGSVDLDGHVHGGDAEEGTTPDGTTPDEDQGNLSDAAVAEDAAPPPPDIPVTPPDMAIEARNFSFFITSLEAIRRHSGSEDGFGGDYGGLEGADELCQTVAGEVGMGHKTWRAFLSVTNGPEGGPVHAIERIGEGPWYDANGRLISENIAGLLAAARPAGDPQTINDLPDEHGVPLSMLGNSHDIPTGSNQEGRLAANDPDSTCQDWTSAAPNANSRPMGGHSYPRMGRGGRPPRGDMGAHWISDHPLRGCTPGVNLIQNGAGEGDCIGCSGGYGGLYCFALTP